MPLQKSFSEQNHSSKNSRPRWQRNRTYQGIQRRSDQNVQKPGQDESQVPISSVTKNKLNVFQFGVQPTSPEAGKVIAEGISNGSFLDDKENFGAERVVRKGDFVQLEETIRVEKAQEKSNHEIKPEPTESPSKNSKSTSREIPTTPAGRLPLHDLIGMVEVQTVEHAISPDERITWNYDPDATHNAVSSYRALKRVKKRARSSSPTSSPAQASAHFSSKSETFDLQKLNQSLKTPQADPGRELWGRYGVNTTDVTPQGPQLPALARIMYTSSPQSSKEGSFLRGESSMRRSIGRSNSCGTEWPKRRKIGGLEDHSDDMFIESGDAGPSKLSLVSALLGKVHGGFTSSAIPQNSVEPFSSSPALKTSDTMKQEESSPLRQATAKVAIAFPDIESSNAEPQVDTNAESSSSDYGDFDDEMFTEDMAGPKVTNSDLSATRVRPAAASQPQTQFLNESYSRKVACYQEQSTTASKEDGEGEFGDSDDEVCAADLENIAARYDASLLVNVMDAPSFESADGIPDSSSKFVVEQELAEAEVEFDDEYGDDFTGVDFEAAEAVATQSLRHLASSPPTPTQKARAIQRYLVKNVVDCQYETQEGRSRQEKVLLVEVGHRENVKSIHLRDGWLETPVTPKAYVHIIGDFKGGRCIIDDVHNMLILHPDHLISATVVADSFTCSRRAVLQDRVKATNATSPPLVYGTILHEIFQAAMMANRWDSRWLSDLITATATRHLEDLYTIHLQIPQAVQYLQSRMGELQSWAEVFVSSKPNPEAVVKTGNGESATMCVSKLLDVEEHVWSPMYGLKGNIDATVQVTMKDGKVSRTLTVPFEVKTGKNVNASHRAQTALYNLLLSDRYDIDIACGILYYMETSETIRIPEIRHEVRHMIMQRNELACFVRERNAQLPPVLKKEHLCKGCYAQVPCFIYHRLADDGDGETSGMKSKFDDIVKHLTPTHKEFFLKWDNLLTREEKESLKFRRELWTMLSSEREELGRCFSNVIIEPGSTCEDQSSPKINRFRYTLIKERPSVKFSFLDSQITVGEPIVISDEKGNFALANGYVTHVRKRRITVAVDRRLHNARIRGPDFNELDNQVFAGIMEVPKDGVPGENSNGLSQEPLIRYRLDKDEFSNGMATVRNNLIQIMAEGPYGSREIRNLVVDLVAPQFKPHSTAYTLTDRANINVDQRRAIEKVMSAKDYALVLGMPGTGKTTTIAHIIRALVSQRKSVLLASYTHTAVDNILLKLKDDNIPILRLGAVAKVSPEVQEFAVLANKSMATMEELRSSWHDTPIVATTCLGINHAVFNERTFDYCIVDEASQITLPVCLGPIRMARTFVLVGDHNQLPPLVKNEEARTGGLDISLFKYLSDIHPSSVVNLEHQYRMCEEVMTPSNELIYEGRLKCGTPAVATRSIVIPKMEALKKCHFSPSALSSTQRKTMCIDAIPGHCWLRDLIHPSTKVSFVNTDPLLPTSREEEKGNRTVNSTEAKICMQLVESLLTVGVPASSIGVITHYRSQLALLRYGLRNHGDVEMDTADRFQGRDKEVIILSLVRSNEAKSIGDLLKDWRRINVAFTRAKTKLLVIGSRETLKGNASEEMVSKFVRLMEEKSWIYDLPKGALESHTFDACATQMTATQAPGTQWAPVVGKKKCDGLTESAAGKENRKPDPKRAKVGARALLAGRPVLRDIVNDLIGA